VTAAQVTAVAESGGAETTSASDAEGRFELQLEPRADLINIHSPGFVEESRRVSVQASGAMLAEFVLRVAGFTQSIEVNGHAPGDAPTTNASTKTPTPLRDVPQAVTVIPSALIRDQLM